MTGLTIYPDFTYPNCPSLSGSYLITSATTNLNCSLYDSSNTFMRNTTNCYIAPNSTYSNSTYYLGFYYSPNNY